MLWIIELILLRVNFACFSLPFYFYSLILAGSSVSGGSEEELEATLRKWNILNNSQGELLKTEVQMFQKQVLLYK